MGFFHRWKYLLAAVVVILVAFVVTSIFDVLAAVVNLRFYSTAAFITIFGVGGIFAGLICYVTSIGLAPEKNESARWSIIAVMIGSGLLFFFPLATVEGGEYEAAFKSFGVTLALSSLLFMKGKIN